MTDDAKRAAREAAEKALTAYRRAEILCHRYGRMSVAEVEARRVEYHHARDKLAALTQGANR